MNEKPKPDNTNTGLSLIAPNTQAVKNGIKITNPIITAVNLV